MTSLSWLGISSRAYYGPRSGIIDVIENERGFAKRALCKAPDVGVVERNKSLAIKVWTVVV